MKKGLQLLTLQLIALLLLNTMAFSQDPNFYIYLCFGQSNMEGQGKIETQDRTVNSRFQVLEAVNCSNLGRTKGKWYTAVPPLCRCYTGLSPADYFGRTMIAYLPDSIKVGVVNVSVAGCKIELFDKHNYQTYVATAPSWMLSIINEYGGNPYGRLVEMGNLAQQSGVIKGILLHQGESNTDDNQWPLKVKAVYDTLLQDLGLTPNSVPILAGEVVHADQGGVCASMNSIIAKLPQSIPNAYVISSSGCSDTTDNLHFNSAGYRELGRRYAVKMLSLMGITPSSAQEPEPFLIKDYKLEQNYPNPFNSVAVISYHLPANQAKLPALSNVTLKVFDILGKEVAILVNEQQTAGSYEVKFDASHLTSGIYFYRLQAGLSTVTRKMILLR